MAFFPLKFAPKVLICRILLYYYFDILNCLIVNFNNILDKTNTVIHININNTGVLMGSDEKGKAGCSKTVRFFFLIVKL